MNTVKFLKNYKTFAAHARYQTSLVYLENLERVTTPNNQKLMMARIVSELIASTEDLSMWLVAIKTRNDGNTRYGDIWERLLSQQMNEDADRVLTEFNRVRTAKGFLKKIDFPTMQELCEVTGLTTEEVEISLQSLLSAIKSSIHTRKVSKKLLVRFHNKVKHGMMIYLDPSNLNSVWARDYSAKYSGKKSARIVKRNREMKLEINVERAKKIVGTTEAISIAIRSLITLLLFDFEYRLKTGKIRMSKKKKIEWLKEITEDNL